MIQITCKRAICKCITCRLTLLYKKLRKHRKIFTVRVQEIDVDACAYDTFLSGFRFHDNVALRIDDLRITGIRAVGGDVVDGGDVRLVLDGARLEKRFPMGAALGRP